MESQFFAEIQKRLPAGSVILSERSDCSTDHIILVNLTRNRCTPYATWNFNDACGACSGHYFVSLEEAKKDFAERL